MIRVNLLEPKGKWTLLASYKGLFTFVVTYPPWWHHPVNIMVWNTGTGKSYYSLRKAKPVEWYKEN
jgi:hypothetical protein